MRLEGKVAIVTGGANGIGKEICLSFANQGARVIAADMQELSYTHENVKGLLLNVTDSEACKLFFDEVIAEYGQIDILVNNAGITRDSMTRKMTDDQWNLVIDVNLKGVFNLVRHIGPQMEVIGGGSIINISSVVGEYGNIGQANYAASKAGLIGFTKSIAAELGSRNIRCNAIAPGFIETDMTASLTEAQKEAITNPKLIPFHLVPRIAQTNIFDGIQTRSISMESVISQFNA